MSSNRRVLQGVVTSPSKDKTATVRIDSRTTHDLYKKVITRSNKYRVHVPEGQACSAGDTVRIQETSPMSKTKFWQLVDVVERAN